MTLVSENIRFMRISAGVPLGRGVEWQRGCRRRQFLAIWMAILLRKRYDIKTSNMAICYSLLFARCQLCSTTAGLAWLVSSLTSLGKLRYVGLLGLGARNCSAYSEPMTSQCARQGSRQRADVAICIGERPMDSMARDGRLRLLETESMTSKLNPTPSIGGYSPEKQSCQISCRSVMKQRILGLFEERRPNKNKSKNNWRLATRD